MASRTLGTARPATASAEGPGQAGSWTPDTGAGATWEGAFHQGEEKDGEPGEHRAELAVYTGASMAQIRSRPRLLVLISGDAESHYN